jgi:hypothetical protein
MFHNPEPSGRAGDHSALQFPLENCMVHRARVCGALLCFVRRHFDMFGDESFINLADDLA